MELKLKSSDNIKILVVEGEVSDENREILKAGVKKLIDSGCISIVLDISSVQVISDTSLLDIASLKKVAAEFDSRLILICNNEMLTDAEDIDEAIEELRSPLAQFLQQEAKLQTKQRKLEVEKHKLIKRLETINQNHEEIKKIKNQKSFLNEKITLMENSINIIMKTRKQPVHIKEFEDKIITVEKVLLTAMDSINEAKKSKDNKNDKKQKD